MSALHNTPERLAGLEIDMENRAKRRDREARKLANFSKAGKTANELRLIYRDRGRTLDDDRQGRGLFAILLHTIANTGGNVRDKMEAARREFAPWLPDADIAKLADEAISVHRRWKADKLAQRIGLTYADRQRLGVTMIGAINMPKAERDRLREARKVEARRSNRRAAGLMPRDQYLAASLTKAEPWTAERVSRATWYRRRRDAVRQVRPQYKEITSIAGVTLVSPSPAARPLARHEERLASSVPYRQSWVRAVP